MKLVAVTSYYNPCRYRTRSHNYRCFRDRLLSQGVPLVTVEHTAPGAPPELAPRGEVHLVVSGGDVMWQKERLLNHAIAQLPAEYDAVAWLDCDVLFLDPNWAAKAERLLENLEVIQLFQTSIHLPAGQDEYQGDGILIPGYLAQPRNQAGFGQVGLAWAARRRLLARHGLYDASIIGGGDSLILHAIDGKKYMLANQNTADGLWAHYLRWAERFAADVEGRYGYLPAALVHLWHGDIFDRRYSDRHRILRAGQFDPDTDLRVGASGAWEWATEKPELHRAVRSYFTERREDGVAPAPPRHGLVSWADAAHFERACQLAAAARARLGELPVFLYDLGLQEEQRRHLDAIGIAHQTFPDFYQHMLGLNARDTAYCSLSELLMRAPFQRVLWIPPDADVKTDFATLFSALERQPILHTVSWPMHGEGFNNCVIGVDLQRDAGLLHLWQQWLMNCCWYPHLRSMTTWSLAQTDFLRTAVAAPLIVALHLPPPPDKTLG